MIVNNCCVYEFVDCRPSPPVDFLLPLSILPGKSGRNGEATFNYCIHLFKSMGVK